MRVFLLMLIVLPGWLWACDAPSGTRGLSQSAFGVELTTHLGDNQSFKAGDRIQFLLTLHQPAYVYMFYQDAGGQITQLVPNDFQPDNWFPEDFFMSVPKPDSPFEFVVGQPFGREVVQVLAVEKPISVPDHGGSLPALVNQLQLQAKQLGLQHGCAQVALTTSD